MKREVACLLIPALLSLGSTAGAVDHPATVTFTRVGPEFLANAIVRYGQYNPTVAALSNGNFVVAWTDYSETPPDNHFSTAVRAHLFSPTGTRFAGTDFLVNTTLPYDQQLPRAVGLPQGGFVVIWQDSSGINGDGSQAGIRGRRFSSAGAGLAKDFLLNSFTQWQQQYPKISALPNGGFVAVWEDWAKQGGDTDESAIRGQVYSSAGGRVGTSFLANTTTTNGQFVPTVAGLSNGNFVVAWQDISFAPAIQNQGNDIRAQIFGPTGQKVGKEFVANTTRTWEQKNPAAASIGNGRFVIVWEDQQQCCSGDSTINIKGQIFTSAGAKSGPEFFVNDTRGNDQKEPFVVGFPNGRFLVTWTDKSASGFDKSGSNIRARLFTNTGMKLGVGELQVNRTRISNNQENPTAAVLHNGNFVIVWTDWSGGPPDETSKGNNPGIRGQVFHVTN